jgi:hypothetical protein
VLVLKAVPQIDTTEPAFPPFSSVVPATDLYAAAVVAGLVATAL